MEAAIVQRRRFLHVKIFLSHLQHSHAFLVVTAGADRISMLRISIPTTASHVRPHIYYDLRSYVGGERCNARLAR